MTKNKDLIQNTLTKAFDSQKYLEESINFFLPLIKRKLHQVSKFYTDFEDANQDVLCSFIEIIKSTYFHEVISKDYVQGLAYLKKAMNNKAINLINKQTKNQDISFSSFLKEDQSEWLDLYNNIFVEKDYLINSIHLDEFNLSTKENYVLLEYYFNGKKIYEIAEQLDIYPESVSRIKRKAIEKIRKEM